jgi:hypothetical protein
VDAGWAPKVVPGRGIQQKQPGKREQATPLKGQAPGSFNIEDTEYDGLILLQINFTSVADQNKAHPRL